MGAQALHEVKTACRSLRRLVVCRPPGPRTSLVRPFCLSARLLQLLGAYVLRAHPKPAYRKARSASRPLRDRRWSADTGRRIRPRTIRGRNPRPNRGLRTPGAARTEERASSNADSRGSLSPAACVNMRYPCNPGRIPSEPIDKLDTFLLQYRLLMSMGVDVLMLDDVRRSSSCGCANESRIRRHNTQPEKEPLP